jgi:hypothetical protein
MQASPDRYRGVVTTFYSYKGGTGRSMALANTACLIARQTKDPILLVDWDLEAPGLHAYFSRFLPKKHEKSAGLIEFCQAAFDFLPDMPQDEEQPEVLTAFFEKMMGEFVLQLEDLPNVFLLKAGRFDATYGARVADFEWQAFFEKIPSFFPAWARFLRQRFAYVFMDSRTGRGDIPGISTMLMPEKLVLVFTPNNQSLDGVLELAEKAINYRRHSDDTRPLMIYPLPSRMELGEDALRKQWQQQYTERFEQVLRQAYGLPESISLSDYFDRVQIPHVPRMAYGEEIVALEESTRDINSLAARYDALRRYVFENENIWVELRDNDAPMQVYISCSSKDKEAEETLIRHLAVLRRTNLVEIVDFKNLSAQINISETQRSLLDQTDIAVIFISPNYLASDNLWSEMMILWQRHLDAKTKLIPVLLRHCDYSGTPLEELQVIRSKNGQPVYSSKDWDEPFYQITKEIASASRRITTPKV